MTIQRLLKPCNPRWAWVVFGCLFGALAWIILKSPNHLCFDEVYHVGAARLIERLGWKAGLSSPEYQSAAGPLFPAVHLLAAPLTRLEPPAIRFINWFCLAVTVVLTALHLRRYQAASPLFAASLIFAVPFLWPTAGLALTELPALAAFSLFLLLLQYGLEQTGASLRNALLLGGAAGAALGIAILGRQTYLVAVPCVALLAALNRRHWALIVACIVACSVACGWLFWTWRGLVPPGQAQVDQGLRWDHAVMAVTYLGMAALFIAPGFLRPASRTELVLGAVVAGLLVFFLLAKSEPPARSLLTRSFGVAGSRWVGLAIRYAMAWVGTQWLVVMVRAGWSFRARPDRLFLVVLLLAFALAPAKVSHLFSSRYVVGGLGALCLLCPQCGQMNLFAIGRLVLGASIGAATLITYYH